METPGPSQNKWMKALSAQMMFLVILYMAKQRNAGVDRQLILPLLLQLVILALLRLLLLLQVVIPALLRLLLPLLFLPLARQQSQPLQLQPRRKPGTGVLVNTTDIVLFQIALKPTYVSAEGRSVMDMETPGPPRNKWMKALSARMGFLEILYFAKPRNASVNRHRIRQVWYHLVDAAWKTLQKQIGTSATIPPSWCEGEGCQRPHHGTLILSCSSYLIGIFSMT